jgi:hypothetical protein
MKKFLMIIAVALSLVGSALAETNKLPIDAGVLRQRPGEVSAQSSTVTMTEKGLNFLWLNDGYDNLGAISYTIAGIKGTNGRLRLQALGAGNPGNLQDQTYLTLGLSYNLFNAASGFRVDLFGGPKGFNVSDNFRFTDGPRAFVWGFGLSIPLGD